MEAWRQVYILRQRSQLVGYAQAAHSGYLSPTALQDFAKSWSNSLAARNAMRWPHVNVESLPWLVFFASAFHTSFVQVTPHLTWECVRSSCEPVLFTYKFQPPLLAWDALCVHAEESSQRSVSCVENAMREGCWRASGAGKRWASVCSACGRRVHGEEWRGYRRSQAMGLDEAG